MRIIAREKDAFDQGLVSKVVTFYGTTREFRVIASFLNEFADKIDSLDQAPEGSPHSHLVDFLKQSNVDMDVDLICYADLSEQND